MPEPTWLLSSPATGTWADLRQAAAGEFSLDAWLVVMTYTDLRFTGYDPALPGVESSFRGHLFDQARELRWIQEGGDLRWWLIRETAAGPDGIPVTSQCRKYYLWGYWGPGPAGKVCFWEPRLTKHLACPIHTAPAEDRPRVDVVEYLPVCPDVSDLTPAGWMDALNQPKLAGWRLCGLSADRTD